MKKDRLSKEKLLGLATYLDSHIAKVLLKMFSHWFYRHKYRHGVTILVLLWKHYWHLSELSYLKNSGHSLSSNSFYLGLPSKQRTPAQILSWSSADLNSKSTNILKILSGAGKSVSELCHWAGAHSDRITKTRPALALPNLEGSWRPENNLLNYFCCR